MSLKKKSTATQKQGWFSYLLEHLLFTENILIRWIRNLVSLSIILGWGMLGAVFLEADRDGLTTLNVLRYSLAPFAAMLSAFLTAARYLQDVYELPSYRSALRYLFASIFDGPPYNIFLLSGLFLPSLNISDGKQDVKNGDINLLQRIGGPGWLSVEAGNAVLLEYLHSPARVLGPGYHFIPRLQRVEEIFPLEDQRWLAAPIVATTKDGIEVAVHDFQFGYRLAAPSRAHPKVKRTGADPYPFSAKSILSLAYNRSVRDDGKPMEWGKAAQFRLDGKITDYINKNSIDAIIAPTSGDPRQTILDNLSFAGLRDLIKDTFGTEITWLNIGRFDINDESISKDIKDYRLKAWFAQWAGKAELIRAEGKAEQISQIEGGRIEKTNSMLRGILQALKDVNLKGDVDEHLWNIVLARTAQIIEAMTSIYGMETIDFENFENKKGSL